MTPPSRMIGAFAALALVLAPACGDDSGAASDVPAQFLYDTEAALDVVEQSVRSEDGFTVKDVSFLGHEDRRFEAYLVEPASGPPFPGVVFMHHGGGTREEFVAESESLARQGMASVLLDSPWMPTEQHLTRTLIALRRAADLLVEAGADQERLGFVGHSWGACLGTVLSSVDRRFRTYVLVAGVPSLADFLDRPELEIFDAGLYQGAANPVPMLFQFGELDEAVTPTLAEAYVAPAREPKEVRWYATDHRFVNEEASTDRIGWIHEHLDR